METGRQETRITRAEIERRAGELAAACAEQLSARLGRSAALTPAGVAVLPAARIADSDEPVVDQLCRVVAEPPAFLHLVTPTALALTLAGLGLGHSGDELEATRRGAFDSRARSAFEAVARGLADGLQQALGEIGFARVDVQDAREVPEPASDPSWLDQPGFLRARFRLGLDGFPDGCLDLLFANDAGEADAANAPGSVCFVEAVESRQRALAELEPGLGFSPVAVAPADLRGELDERVLTAAALVVPWDVGGQSGLELVELLAGDPRLANVPVVAAAAQPTRERVLAALRAGARSFVTLPYEAAELRRRIRAARGEAAEGQRP